jgi:hypothetical protein
MTMTPFQSRERTHRQRGEGKIGCILSLLVLVGLTATAFKAVPIYWSDNELKDAAKDIASRASVIPVAAIELQLRAKARDLDIGEAITPGAIKATKSGDGSQGTCSINIHYKRKIDLYGIYTWTIEVNTVVSAPYLGGL